MRITNSLIFVECYGNLFFDLELVCAGVDRGGGGVFAAGLWKLRRQPADDAGGRELRRLRIENRTLWLFIALLLLVSRIDRICEF